VQSGTADADEALPGMAHDNDGVNISDEPGDEVRVIYWAWKNLDADYFGLFHYRRYLSFADEEFKADIYNNVRFPTIQRAEAKLKLDEASMRAAIESHDLLVPSLTRVAGAGTLYEHYKKEHHIRDLDHVIAYLNQAYPHLRPYVEELKTSEYGYYCNMFVMKRELFEEYCALLFDVLDDFKAKVDISAYGWTESRVIGFLAERVTSIFLRYLIQERGVSYKELQVALFDNTEPPPSIEPLAGVESVPIILASSDYFVPYVSTLLHSLAAHTADGVVNDVIIFHKEISKRKADKLKEEFAADPRMSIRFANFSAIEANTDGFYTYGQFSVETYFRLFIPEVLKSYSKVLYLDSDLIVNADLRELYNTDLAGYILGACRDPDFMGQYNGFSPDFKPYVDDQLGIKNPYDYFQAGVVLINVDAMRDEIPTADLVKLATSRKWRWLDQDVLNFLAQGKVFFLDNEWNVMHDNQDFRVSKVIARAPLAYYKRYLQARKHPRIIHFAGWEKPWSWPEADMAEFFWKYARESAFYEEILGRLTDTHIIHQSSVANAATKMKARIRRAGEAFAPPGTGRRRMIKKALGIVRRSR
jgi:lipopolysaccharide biosynthesis glycosyltransferase